ncbi:hypothetical protein HN51_021111 [Arachis hypogaea]|uniref:Uncharacterized protein n=1 Tax=Arachis hypogaea TaxID=3818 RepID=A0A445EHX1_ARAHY|nr:protein ENHANCED DISEASE RESISTANCE 4 [Arachis hypogaea]QHO52106.1 uncharacterized protein DS421_2g36710 [Arachis hypogaea]RYR75040.1 hypothetical protein Ahy_A02g009748 [Arachis hypogaea]
MEDSSKMRLVRCPKCQNLLPELADYSVYQCGGCGAVLRAKHNKGYGSGALSEISDEEIVGRDGAKLGNSRGKGVVDLSNNSDIDVKSNGGSSRYGQIDLEKVKNGYENGISKNGFDSNVNKDEGDSKSIRRGQPEQNSHEKGSELFESMSNWRNGERNEMEGFWRKPPVDIEGVRFSTLNYPDEGTSSSYSSFPYNYGKQWRSEKDMDGASRVQHLEQDRAELLRKLDELTNQLNRSPEVGNSSKEQFRPEGRTVSPDPYGSRDTWSSDRSNRTISRQLFGPNKHAPGPPYFDYHRDPYGYTSSHEMAMSNFHPSMHNPNYIPRFGDPFAAQMRRGPNQLYHQFPQQPMHPYFPGRYFDTSSNSYELYAHNAMLHPPSCACFLCYDNKRRGSLPTQPNPAFVNSRFLDTPNDPMLYHHEVPGTFDPHVHGSRTAIPPVHETQLHARRPTGDYNSNMAKSVRTLPRKVMPGSGARYIHPIAGGSPFITCYNCFELLQLPIKALVVVKKRRQKVRCGACSSEISFAISNKKLIISPNSEVKETTTAIKDTANEVVNTSGVNFSSDDYAGYDFHSVDRESPVPVVESRMNSRKPQETQSFPSSSLGTSEDENSPEIMIAEGEAEKSIAPLNKAVISPPPAGFPLQEHFDFSDNNRVINRFGKGNLSSRSEQEKGKIVDKVPSSRQTSLKEVVLATEMDVHDYSNSGASQDTGYASQEHDHLRSNKGGESFFASFIKKGFRDSSQTNGTDDHGKCKVSINGQPLSDRAIKKAEKLAGSIRPGNYWYDSRAGFWGVMGGPCLGIIPPFIEEFNYPMSEKCAGGNTGIFVNGRELHQRDLDLLSGRGLPRDSDRSYIVEISGRILDEDTGEELECLGRLAPTVEKAKHGFGMKVPRTDA